MPPGVPNLSGSYQVLELPSAGGRVASQFYSSPGATRGVVWVGGIVGGFDSPARELYADLAAHLRAQGVSSLRIRLRIPGWLPGSVSDVLAGIRFLRRRGIQHIALVGHSMGSAIVLQAARRQPKVVRAIVSLASLHLGSKAFEELAPGCACLFVHGGRDAILPASFSVRLHERAAHPKRLLLLPNAGHRLTEARAAVRREVLSWIQTHLADTAS